MLRGLQVAFSFLSVLPVGRHKTYSSSDWGRSVIFFPVVGLTIGIVLFCAQLMTDSLPHLVQAALILSLWVGLTGGLHLDGLADSMDALAGGHGNRNKMLQILKDPSCGPMGVIAIILVLIIKFSVLSVIVVNSNWSIFIYTPLLARALLIYILLSTPYAKDQGIGAWLAAELPRNKVILMCVIVVSVTLIQFGWYGLGLISILSVFALMCRRWMLKKLGGFSGDFLGAICELAEVLCLVYFVSFAIA